MALRHRLDELERKVGASSAQGRQDRDSPLAAEEVREIDRDIKRLKAEIAEAETRMTPEEVERARLVREASEVSLRGLPFDDAIAKLKAEITLLEAECGEGGG